MPNKKIEYTHQGNIFEGYLAYPETKEKRPLVLLAHAWAGRDQLVCKRADQLADMGYVGFAMDVYGKGKIGKSTEENSQLMQPLLKDRQLLLQRLLAGFNTGKSLEMVDSKRIAAIGYCFGGLCVLDLARSGADLKGVVSFHGILIPSSTQSEKIKSKVLVIQGFEDSMVPPEQVLDFEKEMTKAKADWQLHMYGNTMHAFTNPQANEPQEGRLYNPTADKRSWQAMKDFFNEIFQ